VLLNSVLPYIMAYKIPYLL